MLKAQIELTHAMDPNEGWINQIQNGEKFFFNLVKIEDTKVWPNYDSDELHLK